MSLKPLRIMSVGRPHAPFWKDAAAHYLERLARFRQVTDTVIRDSDPALPVARRVEEEGKRILAALAPQDIVICLDEKGRSMTSREFSRFLEGLSSDATRRPCFIVGGPFGLHDSVREKARHLMALGPQHAVSSRLRQNSAGETKRASRSAALMAERCAPVCRCFSRPRS